MYPWTFLLLSIPVVLETNILVLYPGQNFLCAVNLVGSEEGSESRLEVVLYVDTLLLPALLIAQVMMLHNEEKNSQFRFMQIHSLILN